ncbi:MAG: hypothetical protein CL760_00645 [Chloroflexi bacterium]|nr:hypothetical protein [Chloroflexota bacterium]
MKKIILGSSIAVILVGAGYSVVDHKYNEIIKEELNEFSMKLEKQNIEFSYGEIDAHFLFNDILINDINLFVDKGTDQELYFFVKKAYTNEDTFTPDELGMFPKMHVSLEEGYFQGGDAFPIQGKTYFEYSQSYSYDDSSKNMNTSFSLDIKGLAKLNTSTSFENAEDLWFYLSTINKETGEPEYKVDSKESFQKAFGDFSVSNINIELTDDGVLNSLASYGVSLGHAESVQQIREQGALQMGMVELNFPRFNGSLSKMIKEGGTLKLSLEPESSVKLFDLMSEVEVQKTEMDAAAKILDTLNFQLQHSK